MSERPKTCEICEKEWRVAWTDTHGVAQCHHCGASYRLIHYDADNKHEDKPPECTLNDEGRAAVKKYYEASGRPVPAEALGLSFGGGQSAATREDVEAWEAYREAELAEQEASSDE